MMGQSGEDMARCMMEAIADFSRRYQGTGLNLVRVVIFQAELVPVYLTEMQKATQEGSSLFSLIKAPFTFVGNAIKGNEFLWFSQRKESQKIFF